MDLALNNLQRLICHKTKQTKPIDFHLFFYYYFLGSSIHEASDETHLLA